MKATIKTQGSQFTVEKGDKLYVGANGTAQKANEGDLVGIALESNERFEEKLVEVFIKI